MSKSAAPPAFTHSSLLRTGFSPQSRSGPEWTIRLHYGNISDLERPHRPDGRERPSSRVSGSPCGPDARSSYG
ncbi:hypothetical protein [Lysobacter gummosus]|uniref:hypothetical protein n=1 Tax=Lysobacter gummosus TaxID=262324 RepID=UPI00362ABA33